MKEFTKVALGQYCGVWVLRNSTGTKFYAVTPHNGFFVVSWGKTLAEVQAGIQKIKVLSPDEVYNRILSKARGGFVQDSGISPFDWDILCDTLVDSIAERLQYEYEEFIKRKPRKRKLSLLDWIDGAEEYRENEIL